MEIKDKVRHIGPEAPDRIYVFGQDQLPEARGDDQGDEIKREIDEDVCLMRFELLLM